MKLSRGQSLAFHAAFFTNAWLRRMVAYGAVVYGFEVLGGGRWSGFFYLCLVLPYLCSIYAGSVIDAVSKKTVLQVTEGGPFLLFGLLAFVEYRGWLGATAIHGWLVAAFIASYGLIAAFAYPAFLAAIPEAVGREQVERTTAIVNVLGMLCHAFGPLGVGTLRALFPWWGVFAAFALLAGVSWLFLQLSSLRPTGAVRTTRASEWSRLRDLYEHFRRHPSLTAVLTCVAVFAALVVGPLEVLAPLFAERSLAATPMQAGVFIATGGAGLFVGAIAALKLIGRGHLGAWLCGSGGIGALLILVMTWAPRAAVFPLFFLGGFLGGLFSSLSVAGIQARAPDALRGRVLGLFTVILGASPALGGLVAGAFVESVGTIAAMRGVFATVALAFATLYLTRPILRDHRESGSALG